MAGSRCAGVSACARTIDLLKSSCERAKNAPGKTLDASAVIPLSVEQTQPFCARQRAIDGDVYSISPGCRFHITYARFRGENGAQRIDKALAAAVCLHAPINCLENQFGEMRRSRRCLFLTFFGAARLEDAVGKSPKGKSAGADRLFGPADFFWAAGRYPPLPGRSARTVLIVSASSGRLSGR